MLPRMRWLDAVRARNYHRDLRSIYKEWTENEMTIETLLKDILATNKEIAAYLKHPPVVVTPGLNPPMTIAQIAEQQRRFEETHHRPHPTVSDFKVQPVDQYLDPDCISVQAWADAIARLISRFDLDGKELIVARTVYWALQQFYRLGDKPEAQTISRLQVAISEIMRGQVPAKHEHYERRRLKLWSEAREVVIDGKVYKSNRNDCVPRPAEKITRDQVERAILRATDSRTDIIPTYRFADAVDNLMELIDGSR